MKSELEKKIDVLGAQLEHANELVIVLREIVTQSNVSFNIYKEYYFFFFHILVFMINLFMC